MEIVGDVVGLLNGYDFKIDLIVLKYDVDTVKKQNLEHLNRLGVVSWYFK